MQSGILTRVAAQPEPIYQGGQILLGFGGEHVILAASVVWLAILIWAVSRPGKHYQQVTEEDIFETLIRKEDDR